MRPPGSEKKNQKETNMFQMGFLFGTIFVPKNGTMLIFGRECRIFPDVSWVHFNSVYLFFFQQKQLFLRATGHELFWRKKPSPRAKENHVFLFVLPKNYGHNSNQILDPNSFKLVVDFNIGDITPTFHICSPENYIFGRDFVV